MSSARRTSSVVLALAALVVSACGGGSTETSTAPTTAPVPEATTTSAAARSTTTIDDVEGASSPTTAPVAVSVEQTAEQLVLDWITAVAKGETEVAWSLLSDDEQANFGDDIEAFADLSTELAEGWGSWASAALDAVHVGTVYEGPARSGHVVTLVGTVVKEGDEESAADALGVIVGEGGGVCFGAGGAGFDAESTPDSTIVTLSVPAGPDWVVLVGSDEVEPDVEEVDEPDPHLELTVEVADSLLPVAVTAGHSSETGYVVASAFLLAG